MATAYRDTIARAGMNPDDPLGLGFPVCRWCGLTQAPGVACKPLCIVGHDGDLHDDYAYSRAPYGVFAGLHVAPMCVNCNAPMGGFHHGGCPSEQCMHGYLLEGDAWGDDRCPELCEVVAR